ncbi:PREDICTED: uncharacterized protein LOC106118018 isoform X2 [Papilio xuthus]|uniref:Uncharacterized protein LOC106118018 isoform X2 n=1 Tax=Papilio xuthus TaxID=66420 RepID=A0AAJ6Z9Y0_PAPXU|nr:PREDICTED: uncharacterized protein LOC106118018 isoform X2 [Papilio xuthus]
MNQRNEQIFRSRHGSSKAKIVCQICGLKTQLKNVPRHVFMARVNTGVKATNKEDLTSLPLEKVSAKFVCKHHFQSNDLKPSLKHLNPDVIASLKLTPKALSDDLPSGFPLPSRNCDGRNLFPNPPLNDVSIIELQDHDYCINTVREIRNKSAEYSVEPNIDNTENPTQASDVLPIEIQETGAVKTEATDTNTIETNAIETDSSKISPNESSNNNVNSTNSEQNVQETTKANKSINRWLQQPRYQTLTAASGLYTTVLSDLKEKAKRYIGKKDTVCVLLFDEIKLQEHVYYNSYLGKVVGYVDLGEEGGRGKELANHVLVFMLGNLIYRPFLKQPIAHYFFRDKMSTEMLSKILITIIKAVRDAGYMVMASVCEDKQTYVDALNLLKGNTDNPDDLNYYLVDNEKVYIIYDVPRLFMAIRNNLIQYGEMVIDNKKLKWSHLIMAQEKNNSTYNFFKVKSHVNDIDWTRNGIKLAIQIFSNTMAAILKLLSESVDYILEEEELFQAGIVIEYLDILFDCTNGPLCAKDFKQNRKYVMKNSNHHDQWIVYKRILSDTYFFIDNLHYAYNVKCMKSYVTTISSLQDIWRVVTENDFTSLNLRKFNLDALHSIFECLKEELFNNSVTSYDIEFAINAYMPKTNSETNCANENILFHNFVNQKAIYIKTDLDLRCLFFRFDLVPIVYISSYCAAVILKNEICENCHNILKVSEDKSVDSTNMLNKYWRERLPVIYPSDKLCDTVQSAMKAFERDVQHLLHIKNILNYSVMMMSNNCDVSWMCKQHRYTMSKKLFQNLSYLLIRNNCWLKNEYLMKQSGKTADKVNELES